MNLKLPPLLRSVRPIRTAVIAGAVVLVATVVEGGATAASSTPAPDAAVERSAAKPPLLLPDLMPLKAVDLYIEGRGNSRALRFQSGLANIGAGPMEARPDRRVRCGPGQRHSSQVIYRDVDRNGKFKRGVDKRTAKRKAGCMVFHPAHNHWHFEAASRYLFYKPDHADNAIKIARKMSFCLRDSMRVPDRYGRYGNQPLYYRECSQNSPQGISRGWVDVYASYLSGQSIALPDRLENGTYCVAIQVDPLDQLQESDESNNVSTRTIRIKKKTNVNVAPNRICRP